MSFKDLSGQKVPSANFVLRENGEFKQLSTDDVFKGKNVILFALPGAFTPTCSSTHLPRYNQLAKTFGDNGVDEIICLSVNDTFVMDAWAKDQKAENIRFLPDGNGEFSEKMGLLVDKQELGFGKRSWRYSMYVEDGVIKKMFIEPNKPGDPFEVSDADTMINYLNADAKLPESISLFTKPGCPFCKKAKELLESKGLDYEELVLGQDATVRSLEAIANNHKVPQVFIGGKHIGGSDDLETYFKNL